jgi:hypothetical protein
VTSTTIAACEGKPDAVGQLGVIADHNTAPGERGHRMPSAGP